MTRDAAIRLLGLPGVPADAAALSGALQRKLAGAAARMQFPSSMVDKKRIQQDMCELKQAYDTLLPLLPPAPAKVAPTQAPAAVPGTANAKLPGRTAVPQQVSSRPIHRPALKRHRASPKVPGASVHSPRMAAVSAAVPAQAMPAAAKPAQGTQQRGTGQKLPPPVTMQTLPPRATPSPPPSPGPPHKQQPAMPSPAVQAPSLPSTRSSASPLGRVPSTSPARRPATRNALRRRLQAPAHSTPPSAPWPMLPKGVLPWAAGFVLMCALAFLAAAGSGNTPAPPQFIYLTPARSQNSSFPAASTDEALTPASLRVDSFPAAQVYVDDGLAGESPGPDSLFIAPGHRAIELLARDGSKALQFPAAFEAGKAYKIRARLDEGWYSIEEDPVWLPR